MGPWFMVKDKIKTAILGLSGNGGILAQAVANAENFEIAAVADNDISTADSAAKKYKCFAFNDYRQLIMQSEVDCLVISSAVQGCEEHIKNAMRKKINIFKSCPAGKKFENLSELVLLADQQGVEFAIANPYRYCESFCAFKELLQRGEIEDVYLLSASLIAGEETTADWENDPKLSGGGVILHDCYQLIDQIIVNFSLPEQVYCLCTNKAQDRKQRLYLSEDTSLLTMRFSDTFFGNLIATRRAGNTETSASLKIYAKDRIITVTEKNFIVSDSNENILEARSFDYNLTDSFSHALTGFAEKLLYPDQKKLLSSGAENLYNMAVIESAYLSWRTGVPEEPARILEIESRQAGLANI